MIDKITILIVDDHALVRQGVRAFLETQADIEIVGEADSGETAVELCATLAPDAVLLDLMMPQMNGVEATRQIKKVSPRTNIIVLTSYHDDEFIIPAIKSGALSYLLKDVSPTELVEAVRKASRGEAVLHQRVAAKLMQGLRNETETNALQDLSRSEREVLRHLSEGFSNADIAEKLYVSEKTIKSHVSNILSKLHLANRTQAAI
ncbi:MAG: response regulator transcription factor, partial [Pyrinomonadaceae bacterium]|nr:response regulator transcription factor [Pyrinomonadaceae bacterium]